MAYLALARRRPGVPPLVLVGPGSQWAQGGSRIGPQIRATGYLERADVRALISSSAMLVLPSLEEGFGLPVIEAMAAGLPVVCSTGSALSEVAGDAALLVEPRDANALAQSIDRLLDDASLRGEPSPARARAQPAVRLGQDGLPDPRLLPEGPWALGRSSIGIDGRELAGRPTGTGRYLRNLLRHWREGDDELFVYFNGAAPADPVLDHRSIRLRPLGDGRARGLDWLEAVLPSAARADRLDVFFSPAYSCPLTLAVPRVTAVHDLSFFAYPQDFRFAEALRRRVAGRRQRARLAVVLVCSEFTRRELVRLLPSPRRARTPRPARRRRRPAAAPARGTPRAPGSASRAAGPHRRHRAHPPLHARAAAGDGPAAPLPPRAAARRGRREPDAAADRPAPRSSPSRASTAT